MKKKEAVIKLFIIAIFIALFSFMVNAGFIDWFSSITGLVTSGTANVSVVVGNTAPTIVEAFVAGMNNGILEFNPVENGNITVNVSVNVNDADGNAGLTASANITFADDAGNIVAEEAYNANSTCTLINNPNADRANFTCSLTLAFYDEAGTYNISVLGSDGTATAQSNSVENITYLPLSAIILSSNTTDTGGNSVVNFPEVSVAQTDVQAEETINITNTGNVNYSETNITIRAFDLEGDTGPEYINASNFTINSSTGGGPGCTAATVLVNDTDAAGTANITGASLNNGPQGNDLPGGTANVTMFFCLEFVPGDVSQQTFDTSINGLGGATNDGRWQLAVVS